MRTSIPAAVILACILCGIPSCDNEPIDVDAIARGERLDNAVDTGVDDFFQKRMTNRPRKVNVGSWEILYENDSHVYFALPRLASIWSQRRVASAVYRSDRRELAKRFPAFRSIAGNEVRLAVFHAIGIYRNKRGSADSSLFLGWDWKARLDRDGINVDAVCGVTSGTASSRVRYLVSLDAGTLAVRGIKEIGEIGRVPSDDIKTDDDAI